MCGCVLVVAYMNNIEADIMAADSGVGEGSVVVYFRYILPNVTVVTMSPWLTYSYSK